MAVEWLVFAGVGVGALLVGGAVGYLLGGRSGSAQRVSELEAALESRDEEMSNYRSEVYAQFSETADRFKALDDSYHALHRQLATSAVALCGDQATPLLTQDLATERVAEAASEKVVDEVDAVDEVEAAATEDVVVTEEADQLEPMVEDGEVPTLTETAQSEAPDLEEARRAEG